MKLNFDMVVLGRIIASFVGSDDPVKDTRSQASAPDKETSMSAFLTPVVPADLVLVRQVASAIFRECGFTQHDVQAHQRMFEKVASALSTRSDKAVRRIALCDPGFSVKLTGGRKHCGTWAHEIATAVIVEVIRDIVQVNPSFGEEDETLWVFYGRCLRNHVDLPLTDAERLYPVETDFVDLWGSADNRHVLVRYGAGRNEHIVGHIDGLGCDEPHIREAFRRIRRLPVPALV